MTSVALVILDTETGKLNRYLGLAGDDGRMTKAEWTSSASFNSWDMHRFDEALCWEEIQRFRKGYMPPPAPDNDPIPPAVGAAWGML